MEISYGQQKLLTQACYSEIEGILRPADAGSNGEIFRELLDEETEHVDAPQQLETWRNEP